MSKEEETAFHRALFRVVTNPELEGMASDLEGKFGTMLRKFKGTSNDEDVLYHKMRYFIISEVSKAKKAEADLSLREFSQDERDLLTDHPDGNDLLARLRDGDASAVDPARELLVDIRAARRELGLP